MKIDLYTLRVISLLLLVSSCTSGGNAEQPSAPRKDSIDISDVKVELPDATGKEQVEISCLPCHSLRYIEMQPNMTKKAWEKTVTKMIKNFGAPIKDSITAAAIVNYLVTIKGTK